MWMSTLYQYNVSKTTIFINIMVYFNANKNSIWFCLDYYKKFYYYYFTVW